MMRLAGLAITSFIFYTIFIGFCILLGLAGLSQVYAVFMAGYASLTTALLAFRVFK